MSRSSICKFFNSSRGCRFKENCRFLHTKSSFSQDPRSSEFENAENNAVNPEEKPSENFEVDASTHSFKATEHEAKQNPCYNYSKFGRCRFGENCRFFHAKRDEQSIKPHDPVVQEESVDKADKYLRDKPTRSQGSGREPKKSGAPVCEYFKHGNCRWGNRCRYFHPPKDELIDVPYGAGNYKPAGLNRHHGPPQRGAYDKSKQWRDFPRRAPYKPPSIQKDLKRSQASEEEITKLKNVEIEQLKKRFTKNQLKEVQEGAETCYRISFSSSDPDWPYDVKVFDLLVKFPENYPLLLFTVTLPDDQNLPETVRRYVEVSIKEWIDKTSKEHESQDKVEMVFRPFIKWLDKSLESIVTEGLKQLKRELAAKASGFQFIPASELQKSQPDAEDSSDDTNESETDTSEEEEEEEEELLTIYRKNKDDSEEVYTGPDQQVEIPDENKETEVVSQSESMNFSDEKKGTEIRLRELQLKEQATTLSVTEIKITVQCRRCKKPSDLLTPAGRVNQMVCSKCSNMQYLIYRPVLAHQFSSIIGYLDVEGCVPFDMLLQECPGKVGCLECSKETKIQGISPGQLQNMWCNNCHSKLKIAAESVKFTELQPSGVSTEQGDVHIVNVKKKKVPKDPMIKEGFPLPEYGACKHYKKSYRWFRFPCCGKCYPCDVCHEEKEDHEMVFATRMICGYCCKEQPYAPEKPCILCQHAMTRAKTAHWEGGKGCRDKVKMSRNDKSKYSNQNKTVSRKTQEKTNPVGKKNDKLRHSSA